MCGIIGIASHKPVSINIVNSLKKLEYRGYDSAGLATLNNNLIDEKKLSNAFLNFNPSIVIHLAAQAGVRYSINHPRKYIDTNIYGFYNILLEILKRCLPFLSMLGNLLHKEDNYDVYYLLFLY